MDYEGFFYFEPFTDDFSRHFKVDKIYYQGKTDYQLVQIFHSSVFGKILFLDRKIQSAQIDEFIFHEALVHPILFSHPRPQNILVIGGGEGATIKEVLRHKMVKKVVMVDIDKKLVELCEEYIPEWSAGSFSDKRVQLKFDDARKFIIRTKQKFDVVISDLTEPVQKRSSVYLFTKVFVHEV